MKVSADAVGHEVPVDVRPSVSARAERTQGQGEAGQPEGDGCGQGRQTRSPSEKMPTPPGHVASAWQSQGCGSHDSAQAARSHS